jgi:hypothetical protein
MEEEEVVVTDLQFEWLRSRTGSELDETGELIIRIEGGVKKTFIRQRAWEKTQKPFGVEALAARDRIEAARRLRYGEANSIEPVLRLHEYAILREGTASELEGYCAAEERMTVLRLEQRELIRSVGVRCDAWASDTERAEFLRNFNKSQMFDRHDNLPNWETIGNAFSVHEASLLLDLGRQIIAAEMVQNEISHMVSARHIDSHPEEYPNG